MSAGRGQLVRPAWLLTQSFARKLALKPLPPVTILPRGAALAWRRLTGLLPYAWREVDIHEADTLVVGANPLLGLLALIAAGRRGEAAIWWPVPGPDPWPYAALSFPPVRAALLRAAGVSAAAAARALGVGVAELGSKSAESAADDAGLLALARALCDVAAGAFPPGRLTWLAEGDRPELDAQKPPGECLVYLRRADPPPAGGPAEARILAGLIQAELLRGRPRRDATPRGDHLRALFARRVVVTSALAGFARSTPEHAGGVAYVRFDDPGVYPLGSARVRAERPGDRLVEALRDGWLALDLSPPEMVPDAEP